jgi:Fe-Mn family superoxide dismutase
MTPIEPLNFEHLAGVEALSPRSIRQHLLLYQGYVHKYNELIGKLRGPAAYNRAVREADGESLKGDIAFALASIKNHELLFDTLGPGPDEPSGPLAEAIVKCFHGIASYLLDLRQTAIASRGWAWTAYDLDHHDLFNYPGGARGGMPVWNAVPILAIDLAGHAYFYDFGINKTAYVDAAIRAISWPRVARRFEAAANSGGYAPRIISRQ